MNRRKFVAGLGALSASSGAAIGTGAFDFGAARRDVSVNVADDAQAYLSLQSSSEYATTESDNTITLDFSSENQTTNGGSGPNDEARLIFVEVFEIENRGTHPVEVGLIDESGEEDELQEIMKDEELSGTNNSDLNWTIAASYNYNSVLNTNYSQRNPLQPGESLPFAMEIITADESGASVDVGDIDEFTVTISGKRSETE